MAEPLQETFREHAFRALTEASATLLSSPEEVQVLGHVLDTASSLIAADAYAIWREHEGEWSILSGRGLSERYLSSRVPGGADADGIRSGPVAVPDIAESELLRGRHRDLIAEGMRAMLIAPLRIRGHVAGTLCFYFRAPRRFSADELDVVQAFANLAGSAISTAELYEEQRRSEQRYEFLARASELLSSSLDYEVTLQSVAQAAVPAIADWCSVHIVEGGVLQRIAVAHQDPEKLKLAEIFAREYPEELSEERGAGKQLRTGEPQLLADIPDEMVAAAAKDERHLELIRALGITSIISVPMFARERPVGILRLVTAESKRRLDASDLQLAIDLGRRAAIAIDNARLYKAMLESERRFSGLFENEDAKVPLALADIHGKVLRANRAYCELVGYTPEEVLRLSTHDVTHPDDLPESLVFLDEVGRGKRPGYSFEKRYVRKDGTVKWVRASASGIVRRDGTMAEVVGMFEDITDRKRHELERDQLLAQLEMERGRLEAVVRYTPIGIVLAEAPSGRILMGNPAAEEIFGHAVLNSSGVEAYKEWGAYTAKGERMDVNQFPLTRAMRTGRRVREEMQYRRPDGRMIWIDVVAGPVRDRSGNIVGGVVAIADIDERKHAQEEAMRQSIRVREVLESTTDAVFLLDRDWRFSYLNQHAVDLIAAGKDLLGKNIWQEFTDAVHRQFGQQYHRVMKDRVVAEFEEYYPPPLDKWFSVHAYPSEEGIAVFFHDVTERRKTEQALRQSEKLAAAGRLAASISHEINNPLEAVTNLLYILEQDATLSSEGKSYLRAAQQELGRVTHIATQTLRFYRQSTKPGEISLRDVLDSVLGLYRSRLKQANIEVVEQVQTDRTLVGMVGELRQVFANLVGNALDAIQSNGRITLRVREATEWSTNRRGLRVIVADTGCGMSSETRRRLFEPFYTTKGSTGTGLGLWVSQEIVLKHEGGMRVRSRLGPGPHGTVFSVFLPFASQLQLAARSQVGGRLV